MKKILFLSTDTTHHRYFINFLNSHGIYFVGTIFETTHVQPKFKVGPLWDHEEDDYELCRWKRYLELRKNYYLVKNINDNFSHKKIKKVKPDLGVVFGTRRLLDSTINLFPDGLINIHRGLTQEYRGLDSELWPLYHKDFKNLGVTLHYIDTNLDTGDIIVQEKINIFKNMKCYHLRAWTTELAAKLLRSVLINYKDQGIESTSQDKIGRYYSFMPLELKKIAKNNFEKYTKHNFMI